MEDHNYTVYMHENKINGKKYFGMTGQDPEKRWLKGTNYRTCHAIRRAFEKYGWDGFNHVIIQSGLSREEACELEQKLIAENHTQDPNLGYNICGGGGGMVGFHHTPEECQRISERMRGENNPNFGKPLPEWQKELLRSINLGSKHTEEHKRKIGDSLRGRKHVSEEGKRHIAETHSKSVIRDDGIVFCSIREAAKSIGRCDSAIINAIKRGQRSGKYYWKYAESNA